MLVSHYWGGSAMASKYQKHCVELLRTQFPGDSLHLAMAGMLVLYVAMMTAIAYYISWSRRQDGRSVLPAGA